jgi:hypothetical protein
MILFQEVVLVDIEIKEVNNIVIDEQEFGTEPTGIALDHIIRVKPCKDRLKVDGAMRDCSTLDISFRGDQLVLGSFLDIMNQIQTARLQRMKYLKGK